jgi:hypothetical protein
MLRNNPHTTKEKESFRPMGKMIRPPFELRQNICPPDKQKSRPPGPGFFVSLDFFKGCPA